MKILICKRRNVWTEIDDVDSPLFDRFGRRGQSVAGYAVVAMPGKSTPLMLMHRIIVENMIGRPLLRREVVDHIDGDKMNNQRSNLRTCSQRDNTYNQRKRRASVVKGVCWDRARSRWKVCVEGGGRKIQRRFHSLEEAISCATKARIELHGEFARHD